MIPPPSPSPLRPYLRSLRRALSAEERRLAALAVARRLTVWPAFADAPRIAGYWACDGELDPMPALEQVWAANRQVYLPVLAEGSLLYFAPYRPGAPLRRNRFKIPEPEVATTEWLRPSQLDLVLAPLVAFDSTGTRLGMGGGFYDRSFAFLREKKPDQYQRPCLLGLAYEFQKVATLVRQSWDIPLDAVMTEAALYDFSRPGGREGN
jgi:5-formyltetrahydrofolate cyclo-ligase